MCLCVINCQEESLAARGSGQSSAGSSGSSFSPLFTLCLPSAQTILTRQFSSSATTGMGENSPTTYTLQGSFENGWIFTQDVYRVKSVFFIYFILYYLNFLYFTNVHNLQQAQGEKVFDTVMKIQFRNSNIY